MSKTEMTLRTFWQPTSKVHRLVVCIYVIAFLVATCNHLRDLVDGGILPYSRVWGVPLWMNIYWTGLTLLDPMSVMALLLNVRLGMMCYYLIMVSDVSINWYAEIKYWKQPILDSYGLLLQTVFLVFLVVTSIRIYISRKMD
jgi:hypothetical protein